MKDEELWEELKGMAKKFPKQRPRNKGKATREVNRKNFACKGKRKHASKRAARESINRANFRARPYWCNQCNAYHISNRDKSRLQ